jgi:hypothetical protein
MKYIFTAEDREVYCNGEPLKYVTRPTHEYVDKVLLENNNIKETHDYVNYDDETESFYAADPWNGTRIPGEVVREAFEALKSGQKSVTINFNR